VLTSPAIRRRAKEAGIDLHDVPGTGPRGRITRSDFDAYAAEERSTDRAPAPPERVSAHRASAEAPSGSEFDEVKVVGVRRVIAERMSQSKREIPHFTYVEEVDVTELETLRRHLNEVHQRRLTVLPFIAMALMRVLPDFPQCNARYDAQNNVVQRYRPVHLGIATQTPDGLKVPVVRQAQGLDLWRLADEIGRVAEAAREGSARREELSGSTITITSLGRLGGVVTTPVINYPEMGIIGVNRAVERPVVLDGAVRVRTMMNLSSSFDHRFVDGYDAAAMIQQAKDLLEHPAALFVPPP
jgi:2-oxoisovalerate dehydrogenase E2 component (dihydrolipoyl transacylase)